MIFLDTGAFLVFTALSGEDAESEPEVKPKRIFEVGDQGWGQLSHAPADSLYRDGAHLLSLRLGVHR